MNYLEQINKKHFYYKLGVMCGQTLYYVYKFDSFEKLAQKAKRIDEKYKSDMRYCSFVIQTFDNSSYDFDNSCFCQITKSVKDIETHFNDIAKEIFENYEEWAAEYIRSDNNG